MKHIEIEITTCEAECLEGEGMGKIRFFWGIVVSLPARSRHIAIGGQTPYTSHKEALEGLLLDVHIDRRILPEIRKEVKSLAQNALDTFQYEAAYQGTKDALS